jgi:hypothetical protein
MFHYVIRKYFDETFYQLAKLSLRRLRQTGSNRRPGPSRSVEALSQPAPRTLSQTKTARVRSESQGVAQLAETTVRAPVLAVAGT